MLEDDIAAIRNSVVAVLRVHKKSKTEFTIGLSGSAWCVIENRFFVTAYHVLNQGKPRDQNDKYEILRAPDNGPKLQRIPVLGFVLEDPKSDYAIMEVDSQATARLGFHAIEILVDPIADGAKVFTYGYPSPKVQTVNIDPTGHIRSLSTALFSHANEGILSSQYAHSGHQILELNVGWHGGESGGPIMVMDPPRVVAIMQHHRNIETPHGIVAGPHRGIHITAIAETVNNLKIAGSPAPQAGRTTRAERRRRQRK